MVSISFIVTEDQFCQEMGICHKTVLRMIREGELPDFTYGNNGRVKGWHRSILDDHARRRYELTQHVGKPKEMFRDEMFIGSQGDTDVMVSKDFRHKRDVVGFPKKLSGEEMPQRMRPARKSRIAEGFAYVGK